MNAKEILFIKGKPDTVKVIEQPWAIQELWIYQNKNNRKLYYSTASHGEVVFFNKR